ncbi:MAG: F0F1 ATP synthase subunit delta [Pseudomonadota bacterium]|nr:MAG: F0F1 ATP synthase subunit delta [Pseudomonadota bacterium]
MAEKTTIARPYAQAAFDIAVAGNKLAAWSDMLRLLAMVTSDATIESMMGNASIETGRVVDVILGVCGDQLDDTGKNFVRVLAENHRLNVLPEIAAQYEHYRAEAEKTVEAQVASAFPLSDAQQQHIIEALKIRLGREVTLKATVDESIVGGAVVRAGDLVIDGSVSGQLQKLAANLLR